MDKKMRLSTNRQEGKKSGKRKEEIGQERYKERKGKEREIVQKKM